MKPRKILLTAIGTRGDSQPLVIMAKRLMEDGHICRVAIHEKHRESIEKQGCSFYPVDGFDPDVLMANQMGDRPGTNAFGLRKMYQDWYALVCGSTWLAATEPFPDGSEFRAEVIISSTQQQSTLAIAEKLGAALFFFNTYPMTPTLEFRHPFGTFLEGKDSRDTPFVNWLTYWMYDNATHLGIRPTIVAFRKRLGLAVSMRGYSTHFQELFVAMKVPCLCIWSPSLLPKPHDWHEHVVVCGNVDRTGGLGALPEDLLAFIKAGEPPVFFGFGPGSMSSEVTIKQAWDAAIGAIKKVVFVEKLNDFS